jgi:hypothetical protein
MEIKSPRQLADELEQMAREYSNVMDELVVLRIKKATEIIYIRARESVKSDKQADRIWESSDDGIKELTLHYRSKSLEKLMSAIKTKLRAIEGERYNQH